MILLKDYLGRWTEHEDLTDERKGNAIVLLERVNALLDEAFRFEIDLQENPVSENYISGALYGGFRPQGCPIGAPHSAHKEGQAVDIYDPTNALDNWITDAILERFDLYRESPIATYKWCHLSTRSPKSGKRTFMP